MAENPRTILASVGNDILNDQDILNMELKRARHALHFLKSRLSQETL